jgi:hypothetical protein
VQALRADELAVAHADRRLDAVGAQRAHQLVAALALGLCLDHQRVVIEHAVATEARRFQS